MSDYFYVVLIIFSPLLGKTIKNIYMLYKLNKKVNSSISFVDKIYQLTDDEFEGLVCDYLYENNFSNVSLYSISSSNIHNIICSKDTKSYYISCKHCSPNEALSKEDIDYLLGIMIVKNIHNGIIFTTGILNTSIIDYISSLPKDYNISIITGENLANSSYQLQNIIN